MSYTSLNLLLLKQDKMQKTEETKNVKSIKKIAGATFEYYTFNMRLLLKIYKDDIDDPSSKFITSVLAYIKGSKHAREIMEA